MRQINRRQFVRTAAKGAAAVALAAPVVRAAQSSGPSASDKVVLTLIGAGGRGTVLAGNFSQIPGVEFKYVCDIDAKKGGRLIDDLAKAQGRPPQKIADMRQAFDDKDVDAVVIATPEHWHALAMIRACQAGKDVYVEKCPTFAIWEGKRMIEAARKYNRVVQVGLQNRSAPYAATARDYIKSGQLGKVTHVKVYNLLPGRPWVPAADADVPAGLDWDAWLGPAPKRPYNPVRHHAWVFFWDYLGGVITGDAVHQLDLTRTVLGEPPHPRSVTCVGGNYAYHSERETPEMQTAVYDYGDFSLTIESGSFTNYMKKFPDNVRRGKDWPHWPTSSCRVEIYGTKAMMLLGRHGAGWQVVGADGKVIKEDKGYLPDKWHQPNFIDCVRSRNRPNADIELVHPSATVIHMANISYRVGQKQLYFDGTTETFTNSENANRLVKPAYRDGYRVPEQV